MTARRKRKAPPRRRGWRRHVLRTLIVALLAVALAFLSIQVRILWASRGRVVAVGEPIASHPVAVVFGASVYGKQLSPTLTHRVDTAIRLYREGDVARILVSGDNSSRNYNESDAMRRYVIAQGVPEEHVVSDFAGFSTYDSLYRARDLFGVQSPVLVSQAYHLPRAIYIARRLGLDAVGVAAPAPGRLLGEVGYMRFRETFAAVKAFVEVEITRPPPTYLGEVEQDLEDLDAKSGGEERAEPGQPDHREGDPRVE